MLTLFTQFALIYPCLGLVACPLNSEDSLHGLIGTNQNLYKYEIIENFSHELVYKVESLTKGCFIDICPISGCAFLVFDKLLNRIVCVSNGEISFIIEKIEAIDSVGKVFCSIENIVVVNCCNFLKMWEFDLKLNPEEIVLKKERYPIFQSQFVSKYKLLKISFSGRLSLVNISPETNYEVCKIYLLNEKEQSKAKVACFDSFQDSPSTNFRGVSIIIGTHFKESKGFHKLFLV